MKTKIFSANKKDFRIEWFSGSGAGGQHRNKHQNCCRIIHIPTGLKSNGTSNKERLLNQKEAFNNLSKKIIKSLSISKKYNVNIEVIRNYNEYRNEVHDKVSGLKQPYNVVMNDIGLMIHSRREYLNTI